MINAADARRAALLSAPLLPLLVRQALPTVAVMLLVTLLSVAETWFVSRLGTEAVAAASLVVPVLLFMTMVSNGGIGGGVSSAIARARGAGQTFEAEQLAWHAVVLALLCGGLFTVALWLGGPWLYALLGGRGETLRLALAYSNVLFAGASLSWVLMLLQAALRGAGDPGLPARVVALSVSLGLAISPALIFGWGPLPALGVPGAGVAQVITHAVAVAVVVRAMRRPGASLRLVPSRLSRAHMVALLRVGLPSALNAAMANLALTAVTAAAGAYGVAALAGYGIGARLDTLLVPLLFGFGTAAITVVATNLGAGQVQRARRAALLNALAVASVFQGVGLLVAWQPHWWVSAFTADPAVLAGGAAYLRHVGPAWGALALAMALYFAGQGAGRIGWPMLATVVRLVCSLAAAGLAMAHRLTLEQAYSLAALGMVLGAVLTLYGFWRVPWTSPARPVSERPGYRSSSPRQVR